MTSRRRYRRYRRKKSSFASKVRKVIDKVSETKTAAGDEDFTISDAGVDIKPVAMHTGIEQNQRIGNVIKLVSFQCTLFGIKADTTNVVRFILHIPHCATDTLTNVDGLGTPLAVNESVDLDRFTVLSDTVRIMSPGSEHYFYNLYKKLRARVHYSSNLSTSVEKNNLVLYIVSDSTAPGHPSVKGHWRLKYKDI